MASQIYLTKGTRQENMDRSAPIRFPGKVTQRSAQRIRYLFHPYLSWDYVFISGKGYRALLQEISEEPMHGLWSQEASVVSEKNIPTPRNALWLESELKTSTDERMQTESVWDSVNCVESAKFISYENACQSERWGLLVSWNYLWILASTRFSEKELFSTFISGVYSLYAFRFFNLKIVKIIEICAIFNGLNVLLLSSPLSSGTPSKQNNHSV